MSKIKTAIVSTIIGIFGNTFGKIIGVFIISMIPIIELRGSIPVGFALGLDWKICLICSIIGNILPVPFILLFLTPVFNWMKKKERFKKIVNKFEKKAKKNIDKVNKYQFWGLAIFVGIPLPGTGAWTGSLIASVFDMDKKKAFLSILIGVVIASIIVTALTYGLLGNLI